jgi:SHS2 domain-containing protein
MPVMHELFEHTADIGLRVRAADLDTLFREAAEGLFSLLADAWEVSAEGRRFEFRLEADNRENLLFDWLSELLYTFDTTGCLLGRFDVLVDGTRVEAEARGVPMDAEVHRPVYEVKAITYHGLRLERQGKGWLAEVIVDI